MNDGFIVIGNFIGIFIGLILLHLIYDHITYTYIDDRTRIHKKTGQRQRYVDVVMLAPAAPMRGWVNLKDNGEKHELS